jgi:hypothetical protein
MTTFTINEKNEILAFSTPEEAIAHSATPFDTFSTGDELAQLATAWPAERLLALWNSVPGLTTATEIKDAGKAAKLIFKRLEKQGSAAAREQKPKAAGKVKGGAQAAKGAPTKGKATKKATPAKNAPKAKTAAKKPEASTPRQGSKTELVIGLLKRKNGATLTEIMQKAGWLSHTTRAFVSATLGKKLGLAVESFKPEGGERSYRIK